MSFSVTLTPDLVSLDPGTTTPVSIVVVNKGPEVDRFELEIEGIDPEWKAVPVAVFEVEPGETHTERAFLKPPRASESIAGNYPFVVVVRSLISGESKPVQAVAQVVAFHHLTMEINPKKGYISPTRKNNTFALTFINLGNTEHTLQLLASDPEDECAYEFDHGKIQLGPGQQREVELEVVPSKSPILSSGRLIGFGVSGRSVENPGVVATTTAQLEQRPLLTLTSIALATLVAILVGAWWFMRPKPPTISLSVDPTLVVLGQPVNVAWEGEYGRHITIRAGSQNVYDGPENKGQRQFMAQSVGVITVHGENLNGDQRGFMDRQITVTAPPVVPAPKILSLNATPSDRVKLGQPFLMEYKLSESVTQAILEPTGENLDKALDRIEITPQRTGTIEYTLVAKNSAGDLDRKSFKITVYDESDAKILDFHPAARGIKREDGKVTVSWQVTDAVRIELKAGGAEPIVVAASGAQDFPMISKTTFILTAIDSKNRRTSSQFTVSVLSPATVDPGPDEPPTTAGDPSATTNSGFPKPSGGH